MKKLLTILFLFCFVKSFTQTYNPSLGTVSNKPYSLAQVGPVDGRSYYYDAVNFKWRPYQSLAEVKSYLNLAKYRSGQFPIVVNLTGTLQPNGSYTDSAVSIYWFRDCLKDSCLILKYTPTTSDTAFWNTAYRKRPVSMLFDSTTKILTVTLGDGSNINDTIKIAGSVATDSLKIVNRGTGQNILGVGAAGDTLYGNRINVDATMSAATEGDFTIRLKVDSSKMATQAHVLGNYWRIGGNTVSGTSTFGTISNNQLNFITNNNARGGILAGGQWVIGKTTSLSSSASAEVFQGLQVDGAPNPYVAIRTNSASGTNMGNYRFIDNTGVIKGYVLWDSDNNGIRTGNGTAATMWYTNLTDGASGVDYDARSLLSLKNANGLYGITRKWSLSTLSATSAKDSSTVIHYGGRTSIRDTAMQAGLDLWVNGYLGINNADSVASGVMTNVLWWDKTTKAFKIAAVPAGTGTLQSVAIASTDLTVSGSPLTGAGGTITLNVGTNQIDNSQLRQSAGLSVIGRGANTIGDVADITAVTDGHVLRLSGTTLAFGTIATAGIGDDQVTFAKLPNSSGYSIIGKSTTGAGDYAEVIAAADQVLRRSGSGDLIFGTLVTNHIGNSQITYAKIQDAGANEVIGRAAATTGVVSGIAVGASQLFGRGATGDLTAITLGTNLSMSGTTLNATGGSGTPAGSDTQVQFNDGGAFGADAGFVYNKTTNEITVDSLTLKTSGGAALDVNRLMRLAFSNKDSIVIAVGVIAPSYASLTAAQPITWAFLSDNTAHSKMYFDTVYSTATNLVVVKFSAVHRVMGFLAVTDETLASEGVHVGASVDVDSAKISLYRNIIASGQISGDGTTYVGGTSRMNGIDLTYTSGSGLIEFNMPAPYAVRTSAKDYDGVQLTYSGTGSYKLKRTYSGLSKNVGFYLTDDFGNPRTGATSSNDKITITGIPFTESINPYTIDTNLINGQILTGFSNIWIIALFKK